jgi:hypothetical protein
MVKEELNSEEKFFEKAVMTERFVKKYKKVIIGAVVAVAVIVVGDVVYNVKEQNRIESANKTLAELQKNPNDKMAAQKLNSLSPKLYELWLYANSINSGDVEGLKIVSGKDDIIISDTATYEMAQLLADKKALENYAKKHNLIYQELANVLKAVLLLEDQKIEEADAILAEISVDSPLKEVVNTLKHYGVK